MVLSKIKLLQIVFRFTGNGLRQLFLDSRSFIDTRSPTELLQTQFEGFKQLLQEVSESSPVLEQLAFVVHLDWIPSAVLELVTSCPRLCSLELFFCSGSEQAKFPDRIQASHLKRLKIASAIISFIDLDSPAFLRWAGTGLEQLELVYEGQTSDLPTIFMNT